MSVSGGLENCQKGLFASHRARRVLRADFSRSIAWTVRKVEGLNRSIKK